MITDEEAKKAAEVLMEYCKNYKDCNVCQFNKSRTDDFDCKLSYPGVWGL